MRLRHIKNADKIVASHPLTITSPKENKGKWSSIFSNNNPIFIEIGMGKGKFIIENALKYPNINFIGIERYSSVLLRALQKIDYLFENKNIPTNIFFICMDALDILYVFSLGEISKIYLNFSDPWPKDRHSDRRLTSNKFLNLYSLILENGSLIEFKTDNKILFDFSVDTFSSSSNFSIKNLTYDLHNDVNLSYNNIMTEYEEKFSSMGNPIYKLIAEKI